MAMSAVTMPDMMARFKGLNAGRSYADGVKPFNFALVGSTTIIDERTCQPIKPITTYRKDVEEAPFDSFIDYASGKELRGEQYWKSIDCHQSQTDSRGRSAAYP